MIKASALYIVIVIALVIGLLCSLVVASGFYYRLQYQYQARRITLQNNLASGQNILLESADTAWQSGQAVSLFSDVDDSLFLQKKAWGVYDLGIVKAFKLNDTLAQTFLMANNIDSTKWAALYFIDEDRSISVSGHTVIQGDAYIPKAGVKAAYVNNQGYTGDQRIISGHSHDSGPQLPPFSKARINRLKTFTELKITSDSSILRRDTTNNSFLWPTKSFNFKHRPYQLTRKLLSGNVMLFSDTTITIDSSTVLNNTLIYAREIHVKKGFKGTCQLYATDRISIDSDCVFRYPSAAAILRFDTTHREPASLTIGKRTNFAGLVFTYEQTRPKVPATIFLEKQIKLYGQVYSAGLLHLKDSVALRGSLFVSRVIYQTEATRYENYLINIHIDQYQLSPDYLTSDLLPVAGRRKQVLQWLETKSIIR